jgi:DNA replication protein DnaC
MARNPDASDPVARLQQLLEQLNLTTAARRLGELLAQAETAQPSYSAFLHQILEAEDGARWDRKLQRRRRWSKLGPPVTLDGFDWAARPQLAPQVVKELLTCRFVEEHRNVILVGRPSTGKTTVAKALGHAACARALRVYYASMAEVLQTLHAARADGTYRTVFRRVTESAVLILDSCGVVRHVESGHVTDDRHGLSLEFNSTLLLASAHGAQHASRRVRCSAITFRELTAAPCPYHCLARSSTISTRGYSHGAFGGPPASGTSRRSGVSTVRSGVEGVASGAMSPVTTWRCAGDRFIDAA